ncbi:MULTISPECIES: site-2 protease family protein [unclassified Collinsella]|uniref:site-2 protease family protein n=1 Tax=unclassified Collinsella TaxID=2637548 RepID=UPI003F8F7F88
MSSSYLMNLLASAVAVIVGIVIHESAHAAAAWALGDKTARSRGRVSLNPLNHIDPFGTIILPLLMLAAGGPVFAFAKPVPVYLKHPKRDEVLVSAAGPASNIALACLAAAIMHAAYGNLYTSMSFAVASQIMNFGATFIVVNLSLAFFNLIPIPPLDGSSIIVPFLKGKALTNYYQLQQYAMPILIIVLYLLPMWTGIDVIGRYFDVTVYPLAGQLLNFAIAGI